MPPTCPSIPTVAAEELTVVAVVGKKACGDKVRASKGSRKLVGAKVGFLMGLMGYKMIRFISQRNSKG